MSNRNSQAPAPIRFLFENSIFLISGAVLALAWANIDADNYHRFVNYDFRTLWAAGEADAIQQPLSRPAGGHEPSLGDEREAHHSGASGTGSVRSKPRRSTTQSTLAATG